MRLPILVVPVALALPTGGCGSSGPLDGAARPDAADEAQDASAGGSYQEADSPDAGRLLLFGGGTDAQLFGDTWEWNGRAWRQVSSSGPDRRDHAAAAGFGHAFVLFGGIGGPTSSMFVDYLADTWRWDGTAWSEVASSGPGAWVDASAAPLNDKVVLFGGYNDNVAGSGSSGDTWECDGARWTRASTMGPAARASAAVAPLDGKVVLFGGVGGPDRYNPTSLSDTWTWDGQGWTEAVSPGPSARSGAAAATLDGKVVVLFGGIDGNLASLGDTWQWDGKGWTQVSATGPSPRSGASAATVNGKVVLFGGASNQGVFFGDTWQWDGTTWTRLGESGPPARSGAAMAGF
jgi:N-acetylneuraminic acid mutarotase